MKQSQIAGRIEPLLKARIDNIQWHIDKIIFEHDMCGKYADIISEVLIKLFERKQGLIDKT